MHWLHDLQQDLSHFVFQETRQIPFGIKGNGLSVEQRLTIYRNNTLLGLKAVLRDIYPVVNRLVGDVFFNRLAAAYVKEFPPRSACLMTYGEHFPELIVSFEAAQGLAYLADTARLEWFWHEAYHEADTQSLPLSALAQIDPSQYGQLGFRLHPSARFVASDYPIERIWVSNQADYSGQECIDLHAGGCRLLLYRPQWQVEIHYLTAAEYQFLTLLNSGKALSETVEILICDSPGVNIQPLLQHWLLQGLLSDFFMV